ncbi:MAG: thioredoxin family protein [Verrucomicrobiales bacterium]|nr:thioredoxin family protein [Verrucomicrobiales bacterium]
MASPRLLSLALSTLAILLHSSVSGQSVAVRDQNVEARLISSHSTIKPGEPFTLALQFTIDPTWHTYWLNPGETGIPTSLKLALPAGFTAGELQFPIPKKFITDYGFGVREAGYGYSTAVMHPLTITPPADLKPGEPITLSGKAGWLMCDPNTCVPGKADLSITLQVGAVSVASPEAGIITSVTDKLPKSVEAPLTITLAGTNVVMTTRLPSGAFPAETKLKFYPLKNHVLDSFAESTATVSGDQVSITAAKHESLTTAPSEFSGLLIAETASGNTGFYVSTAGTAPAKTVAAPEATPNAANTTGVSEKPPVITPEALPFGGGLLGILLAAFLGGIILNIMPCVFPVISLKVMSFVGQSGEDRKKVLVHSLIFALGILVFFWVLTTVMLVLRSVGSDDLGWGVQLRQPGFVIGLIFVMVIVALSLFGVFEMGASMTAVGGDLANKSGYAGSFWSGALAVLLATPCTAPLMAPAIGFALAQSAPLMFLIFTTLGLGLAAPYFIFAIFPKLLDVIPPPGAWMETFKQFMGFPMLAVAVWLIGVLSRQLNVEGLQWALAAVLFVAIAGWILGRFAGYERSTTVRLKAKLVACLVFLMSLGIAYEASAKRAPASTVDIAEVIAGHRAKGKHVFVDFTAEWCITCKVNERVAIKTTKVHEAFTKNNIEFVIADWTNKDASIAKILEEYGRAGVPLYLLYPADTSKPAIMIREGIITPGDILDAIAKLP